MSQPELLRSMSNLDKMWVGANVLGILVSGGLFVGGSAREVARGLRDYQKQVEQVGAV